MGQAFEWRVAGGSGSCGFEVLVTADTGMGYQQNLKGRRIALVILSGNDWRLVQQVIRKIIVAVNEAERGTCTVVEIPRR